MSEPSKPLPKLHEPNAEARARGYLRGAVVRWREFLGIVVAHDSEGDPWVDRGEIDAEAIDATSSALSLERPAPAPLFGAAPAPEPAPAPSPIEIMRAELGRHGYWLGSTEMLERAHRVTGGDASRAVDLLLLILR